MKFPVVIAVLTILAAAPCLAQTSADRAIATTPGPGEDLYNIANSHERVATTDDARRAVIPEYEAAAAAGSTKAMFRLANLAKLLGNTDDMFKWLRRMADLGDPQGQYYLASVLRRTEDCAEARDLLRKAAAQGYEHAYASLATFYEQGTCGDEDYKQAADWYEKAARLGVGVAQNNLGYLYLKGQGVRQDRVEAYVWFTLAAAQDAGGRDRGVEWTPSTAQDWADNLNKKLSDREHARAATRIAVLCNEDKVCSRIPEYRRARLLQP